MAKGVDGIDDAEFGIRRVSFFPGVGRGGGHLVLVAGSDGKIQMISGTKDRAGEPNLMDEVAEGESSGRGTHQMGVLPNPLNREGERPREPQHLRNAEEIRAREDARPPIQGLARLEFCQGLALRRDQGPSGAVGKKVLAGWRF